MKILALGDVFGEESVKYLTTHLNNVKKQQNIDFTIANCENASGATGVEPEMADALLAAGCDVLTGGNHTFSRHAFEKYLDTRENVLRPANYPPATAGYGYCIKKAENGKRILTVSLRGNGDMQPTLDCPFNTLEKILEREKGEFDISVVDIHAQYTSEKLALLFAFDGRVNIIFGTHTHVPTADGRISENGTGYITDIGMCGVKNSILGVESSAILRNLRDKLPAKFNTAKGKITSMGAVFETDDITGRCVKVTRIEF